MARILIRQGYDFDRRRTFKTDGQPQDLSGAAISICLKNEAKDAELISDTAQTNTGDADWQSGVVILRFTAGQTAGIVDFGNAYIEVSVTLAGIKQVYEDIPVVVERGFIA